MLSLCGGSIPPCGLWGTSSSLQRGDSLLPQNLRHVPCPKFCSSASRPLNSPAHFAMVGACDLSRSCGDFQPSIAGRNCVYTCT